MHSSLKLSVCSLLAWLAFAPVSARAVKAPPDPPPYDALVVFGDSYNDVGNIYLATKGAIPVSPPYFNGRFSNGPIWVEHVAGAWGLPLTPAYSGGTDFAFGGAWVTAPQVTLGGTIPSVPEQVALYLKAVSGKADPKALYILEGGGNDILGSATTGITPQKLGFDIALGIAESELLLRRAGAKHFLIPNLFDVSLLPGAAAEATFAAQATASTNQYLNEFLALESLLEGIKIYRLDVFSLFQAIKADPNHFGFKNITAPCVNPVTLAVCADPDHTLFWDVEHPTEFGHSFFAVTVENALSAGK